MVSRRAIPVIVVLVLALAASVGLLLVPRAKPAPVPRAATIRQELFAEIQPVHVANCELERFGEVHDGGYPLCANLLGAVKAAYSYGISGYDGWGCDVSRRIHVIVHQYDCFNLTVPICPDGMTMFHGECVGTKREDQDGRPFDTLSWQFAKNGDAARVVVMKMDVEGAEWDSFLFAPDSVFEQIDQMTVEFHGVGDEKNIAAMRRLKQFFDIAHVHYNNFSCDPGLAPFPSWAFEVLLVNKRIAKTDGTPPATGTLSIDAPNNKDIPDCPAPSS